ncbi:hypothetical protein sscle_09g069450 [Sclerotinia sclerotiorum 1980 UF-70]|uniref:Uncharacterized protein n=1 Tax=Sclerotinia sclerotiorum (strain ATCC 18683 / 1980 / Ss-1) TaxID=665079 RepID=A0A1D9QB52_SCLS1|nr:hypothetical protein sscle_09g069450 [Sclerotinia sclerotiorum 1980 UF-70]
MKVPLPLLCVCPFSTIHICLLVNLVNADFTTKNWNPIRGKKFTIAWSGTSDAGLKNLTLNDADSSGNEFAFVQNIATRINGGSFMWLPSTSIPDGTYVVNLYESPNKVDKNGLTFIGKPFVFGNSSANQLVVVDSPTTTAGAAQVVQTTTSSTIGRQQETTVLDQPNVIITSSSPTLARTQTDGNPETTSTSSFVIPTSVESSSENLSISIQSNVPSTFTNTPISLPPFTPTSTFTAISPTTLPVAISKSAPITTSTSTTTPSPHPTLTSNPLPQNPSPLSSKSKNTATLLSTTILCICLLLLSLISIYLLHRYQKIKLKELGLVRNSNKFWYRWENGRGGNGRIRNEGIGGEGLGGEGAGGEKMYYDAQKRNWVFRVNSRLVELEGS